MTRASIEISARLVAQVAPSSRQLPPPRRRLCHSLGILLVPGAHRLAQLQQELQQSMEMKYFLITCNFN